MKVYNFEEAFPKAVEYFGGDELAARVFLDKYALKNKNGELLECTPMDMHKRLAAEFARIESNYPNSIKEPSIFTAFHRFRRLVPQGGIMSGVGDNFRLQSLSNCFAIESPSDSYGGITRAEAEMLHLMKRRGGVGFDLSNLRAAGALVSNAARTSTGMPSFMHRFSNGTREVAQDGRRGALMLSADINHPNAEAFIDAKTDGSSVTGANISVRVDDRFMDEVMNPTRSNKGFEQRRLWDKIVRNAWKHAEPGVLFWDTILEESPADCYSSFGFGTVTTNPCGEIPLCPYDSCRLLAINLTAYVVNPWTEGAKFDFQMFHADVVLAQRLMDDMLDLEIEKIDAILKKIASDPETMEDKSVELNLWTKIREKAINGRRTGLGITGEGDMLAMLGKTYGTEGATKFSVEVHRRMACAAFSSSVTLAKERGAFPIWDYALEKNNPFLVRVLDALDDVFGKLVADEIREDYYKTGRRNIAMLTIAPTGTTSLMTQTTSGIEPVFLPMYMRSKKRTNEPEEEVSYTDEVGDQWIEFPVFHHRFLDWFISKYCDEDITRIEAYVRIQNDFKGDALKKLVAESPYNGATSNDIDWREKVNMQGEIQQWVDHSISVTVNLPKEATVEIVDDLYRTAWESGCKGLTVYRDGSRTGVLNAESKTDTKTPLKTRPEVIDAEVVQFQNNKEKWVSVVGKVDGNPYEIFTGRIDSDEGLNLPKGLKTGKVRKVKLEDGTNRYDFEYSNKRGFKVTVEGLSYKFNSEYWNYAKMISGFLRSGIPVHEVVEVINGLDLDDLINSWKTGVIRSLKGFIKDGTKTTGKICPSCESVNLIYQEGCLICQDCGNSKCG